MERGHCGWLVLGVGLVTGLVVGSSARAATPLAGDNVNMVSGRSWPGGDPFGQRQNEPSIAVSSRNPNHLLAGANDYRTVDLTIPTPTDETSDSWLSYFRSLDGGATWQSFLHPGFKQSNAPSNTSSPLYGLSSASDPVVRAGTNGLFYYSGIAFNRGTNVGKVFVSRFMDLNNQESGDATTGNDPIKFVDTRVVDSGTSGQFQDKPWIATDIPRRGAGTCTVTAGGTTAQFPAGNVYFAYATFTGSQQNGSKVYFSRSLDCGQTWATPQKLSESNSLNQGTAIAVDPLSGDVWVVWRRFSTPSQGDAIMVARSSNFGATFGKATVLVDLSTTSAQPFEQTMTGTAFRTEAVPTIAISTSGSSSWVHVAWSQRDPSTPSASEGRIYMTTFDGKSWSTPQAADPGPVVDDASRYPLARGHQLMPALTFSQGRLMLLYYDSRLDHARRYWQLNPDYFLGHVPGVPMFVEWLGPWGATGAGGSLADDVNQAAIFGPGIDDGTLADRRHTLDVRVAQLPPGAFAPGTAAPPSVGTRVTRFPFGCDGSCAAVLASPPSPAPLFAGGAIPIVAPATTTAASAAIAAFAQTHVNPPDLPMFAQGTLPFIGDYIDIQGPAFVRDASGAWRHNTDPVPSPVFHAVWTSNQDVRGPPAGFTWKDYTPPGSITLGAGGSWSAAPNPACNPALTGMRDQNIYTSRLTEGVLVSSPQNVKPLDANVQRAFVVQVENTTDSTLTVALRLPAVAGLQLSFANLDLAGPLITSLSLNVAPHFTLYRAVFARNGGAASAYTPIPVAWGYATGADQAVATLGNTVTLNPTDANAPLVTVGGQVVGAESWVSLVSAAQVTTNNVTSNNVTSNNVTSNNVTSAPLTTNNVTSNNVTSNNVTSGNIANNVTSGQVASNNVTSNNVTSNNVTSGSVYDVNYTVTNTGNTTHSYHLKLVGAADGTATGAQLILYSTYYTQAQVADPFDNLSCVLADVPHTYVTAVINDPHVFSAATAALTDPAIPDPSQANATLVLPPGAVGQITVRNLITSATQQVPVVPVVVPHAATGYSAPLFVASTSTSLAPPRLDVPYRGTLQAIGGTPGTPYAWSVVAGAPPAGLTVNADGTITGTPSAAGSSTFTVQVSQAGTGSCTAATCVTGSITMAVASEATVTAVTSSPNPASFGQAVTFTATVAAQDPAVAAGTVKPTGSVTFYDGATALSGAIPVATGTATFTTSTLALGAHAITATFASANANFTSSGPSAPVSETVNPVATTTEVTPALSTGPYGTPLAFTATVTPAFGNATPTGTATFFDGAVQLGTLALSAGTATITPKLGVGVHAITATFASSTSAFQGSTSPAVTAKVTATTGTALGNGTSSVYGTPMTFGVTVTGADGLTPPAGTVTLYDGCTTSASGVTPGTSVKSATVVGAATTSVTVSLGAGSHALCAGFSNGGSYLDSISGLLTWTVTVPAVDVTETLSSSLNPARYGQGYTLTATLTFKAQGVPPTGAVTFAASGTPSNTPIAIAGVTATPTGWTATATYDPVPLVGADPLATLLLQAGAYTVTATYGGDAVYPGATGTATQVVNPATTSVALSSSLNPSAFGQTVTFTAGVAVTSGSATPAGTVTFYDGCTSGTSGVVPGTALGAAVALSGATAQLATTQLAAVQHPVCAVFTSSSANVAGSTSAIVTQNVNGWTFTGFLSPLKTASLVLASSTPPYTITSSSGQQQFGSKVPIKWQLQGATGALGDPSTTIASLSAYFNASAKGPNCTGPIPGTPPWPPQTASGAPPAVSLFPLTPGQSSFSYDATTQQSQITWDTSQGALSTGCYDIVLTLKDGSPPKATTVYLK